MFDRFVISEQPLLHQQQVLALQLGQALALGLAQVREQV
jgi:hypothetical protein